MHRFLAAVLLALVTVPNASASPKSPTITAQIFKRDIGKFDADLLQGRNSIQVAGYLSDELINRELLVTVAVSHGNAEQLTVTIRQGKYVQTQSFHVIVGLPGPATAFYPVLARPDACAGPLTIEIKIGKATQIRTLDFSCPD